MYKRIIYIPQYPAPMRYPEWHISEFKKEFKKHFDEVIILGDTTKTLTKDEHLKYGNIFSPIELSIQYELNQMQEYIELGIKNDDVLYLADLSFPGFFSNILHHKKPQCYAYCHATSINNYDYFQPVRKSKWKVECGQSKLFDKIFIGSEYHKNKLGWNNVEVVALPEPPFKFDIYYNKNHFKTIDITSVSRPTKQKVNLKLEKLVEKNYGKIVREKFSNWYSYYLHLMNSKVLIITTREETFGYQAMDAILMGCIPIAPNKFSYPELLPREYLYDNEDELLNIIEKALTEKLEVPKLLCQEKVNGFYKNICEVMKRDN